MRIRSNFYPSRSTATIPKRSNRRHIPNIVEPEIRTIEEIVSMADRTMEELLQAPTEGYGEDIVKTNLLQLVQANKFHGFERDNPHTHISNFKRMTTTLKYRDKEPPNSILNLDDLVNKFVNQFFPPSKTTHLKNEIYRFTQRLKETFGEAWDRFKEMLRACPHHGFSELTQIDTFYNGLTKQDQDSLNAASGGNLLNKPTREALKIIENKSTVRYSRSKSNVSRINTNSKDNVSKTDDRIDKLADQISNLVEIVNKQVIAPTKAVEKTYVTCGGAHAYYDCVATDSYQPSVYAATGSYNKVSPPNRASHQIPPPCFALVQNNLNRFNQNQVPNNQIPPSVPNEFSSYIKSNEIMIKSMQNQINVLRGDFNKQEENLRRNLNNDMRSILGSFFQNQPLTSGTLSSNTVPNPKGEMKAVTTCNGLAYKGPSILTSSPLEKVDEQNTEEILDKEHSNSSGSTAQVQPPVVPILISEPDVLRTQSKPTIPYSARLNENCSAMLLKKLPEKLGDPSKFLIPCDFPGMEVCHALSDLGASINLMPLSIWKKLSLPELTPTQMTLELADRPITHPKGVAEDVFVKDVLDFQYNSKSSSPTLVSDVSISESDSYVEKEALINVLKSHKRAIAWKISDIKGIDMRFCTHKILMEDDYKPEMQSQRRPVGEPNSLCSQKGREGIVLGHKILKSGIEVDRAKVDVIAKLHHSTTVKGVRSFLGHAGFYRRFIQDFSKIARSMTHLLEKETPFVFSKECIDAFNNLKKKLIEAPILVVPDWNLPFKLMCDASDYAIGAVLGQRKSKHFQPIHYAIKTMTEAQIHYTTTKKEMLAVDANPRLLRWVLLLQEFDITILDKKGSENLTADHLSRLKNPHQDVLKNKDINENFPLETLGSLTSHSTLCDCGTHFCNDQFTRVMIKYVVTHRLPTAYHPQTSGQVEVSNRGLKRILERTVGENCASWSNKLDDALWAFHTAYKTSIGCTPYKLVYGISCHLPIKLNENSMIYKERMKNLHDSKIKNHIFNIGDQVLLFNSRLKIFFGKLKTRWSGPFTITRVFPYGTIELSQPNGLNFKGSCQAKSLGDKKQSTSWEAPHAYPFLSSFYFLTCHLRKACSLSYIVVEHASSSGTLSSLQHLTKDLSFGDLFISDKPSEADNEKTTAETKVESTVSVTIQQDISSIPPMTSLIIDLTSRPESPKVHQLLKETTTTTILPPPSQQQQSTTDAMMLKSIGELEHIMADLIQENKRLGRDEMVTDAIDWAMQEPLQNRFRDLPEADIKEILHQRMWETDSYKSHEDHIQLYEALEKSMNHDHSEELTNDLAEARKKKKKSRESPKTPPGSPPHKPSPPPAGPSGASGSSGAFGSSQVSPPPPPPPSTNQEDLQMDEDMAPDEQAQLSDDEDIGNSHIPKASALASNYSPPPEDSLLAQTGDIAMFMDYKPLPLGGPPGQVTIQSDFFFNKDLEYLRYGSKGNTHALSISKMKAAYYPDVGLEKMVPDQMWIEKEYKYDIAAMYEDFQLGIESYQAQLNLTKPRWDATGFEYKHDYTVIDSPRAVTFRDRYEVQMIMHFNEIHKFNDGTLQQIDEALDYRVKEFRINRMNPGLNTRFWTRKDVDRSKEFMFAIQKRLKTKRIFCNLESFVGG
nr:reverse transcriptase domain-containing protein [Tanacetum cinerariifolium]